VRYVQVCYPVDMYKYNDKIITFIPLEEIELAALEQIRNTASVPCLFHHVAVMPDTHYGKGSTVGTVLATQGAVIPAAVGVDIGCGMIAVKTTLKLSDVDMFLPVLRTGIERRVPMSAGKFNNKITESVKQRVIELSALPGMQMADILSSNWREQLGTLGGGNHFIEICVDPEDNIWVTLHSGSRGVGNKIGMHYIRVAQALMKEFMIELADKDLAYIPETHPEFDNYIRDLRWAQHFALLNREEMLDRVMAELATVILGDHTRGKELEYDRVNCHHNFTQIEEHLGKNVWVTRKGAIQAKVGMRGMIPGSMGTRSYIVTGKENPMSYHSAPHGAGRRMSRAVASKTFTMDDFDKAMVGIEHRRHEGLIDEIPGAYKDIDHVMENAKELVEVVTTLKQIMNCKGD
jgi:tRNA-splicing ligase RtcB